MFKRNLFILICFFIVQPSLWADSKQKISCLDQHQPGRTIYRNDQGDVSCVNYGGKKAVQYIYNKIDRIVLGGMRFSSGAVVGKKFYGFKTVNEGTTYLPNTNEFHSTVLSELFSEINTVQTLDQLIREYYPNEEKRNKLLEEIIKDYESSARTILPEGFYEKSYTEKLGWINDLIANDSSEKKDIQDLSILEKSTLQTHLFKTNGQKISISQCNPTVVNFYNTILTENMVGKRNMKNERLFAETNIFDGKIKILFSLFTLENLMDKTINEVSEMLKNEPQDEETSIILSRYNREGSDAKELLELPLLSRIMVHELGHVHQLSMLENESSEYKLNRINISLVARMVKKNEFPSIPMKLKELIKEKILEKVLGVFEYSAEAYFIDAVPCVI